MTWRLLSHTADLKAAIDAPTHRGVYEDAVALVRHLLVGDSAVEARAALPVHDDGNEPAERLFRFIRELLFLYDTERFLPAELVSVEPQSVAGEKYDDERHVVEHSIKALTRHQYVYEHEDDGYHVEMVFDL